MCNQANARVRQYCLLLFFGVDKAFLFIVVAGFTPCLDGPFPSILIVLMLLKDQVALITGSGRGIGRAIAHLFAKEGAAVFLTARTDKELASTTGEISRAGGRCGYATADLSRESDCAQAVAEPREQFGRIDILVNNAGHYGPVVPVEDY